MIMKYVIFALIVFPKASLNYLIDNLSLENLILSIFSSETNWSHFSNIMQNKNIFGKIYNFPIN